MDEEEQYKISKKRRFNFISFKYFFNFDLKKYYFDLKIFDWML